MILLWQLNRSERIAAQAFWQGTLSKVVSCIGAEVITVGKERQQQSDAVLFPLIQLRVKPETKKHAFRALLYNINKFPLIRLRVKPERP